MKKISLIVWCKTKLNKKVMMHSSEMAIIQHSGGYCKMKIYPKSKLKR